MTAKSRKTLLIALAFVVVVGAGITFFVSRLDGIVAGLIEEHGSAATGTDVRVSGVSIDLRGASAALSGLTVANPEVFGGSPAIELGKFSIAIDPSTLTEDTIVLENVTVGGARLRVTQQGARNNLRELLDNMRGGGNPASAGNADESTKKIVIERFVLEDARALVSLPDAGEQREVALPVITLEGIGRQSNGVTAAAATRQLLEPVITRTLQSAAVQSIRDRAAGEIEAAQDKLLEGLQKRLGPGDDESQ